MWKFKPSFAKLPRKMNKKKKALITNWDDDDQASQICFMALYNESSDKSSIDEDLKFISFSEKGKVEYSCT